MSRIASEGKYFIVKHVLFDCFNLGFNLNLEINNILGNKAEKREINNISMLFLNRSFFITSKLKKQLNILFNFCEDYK